MNRSVFPILLLTTLLLLAASASATSGELMSFNGLGNLQQAGMFYDGGGTASTPNYGVMFSSNVYGLSPGLGNFAPSFTTLGNATVNIPTALFICPGLTCTAGTPTVGTMNVAAGFSNGLNFYYTAGFTGGQFETVTIWSGANGTGTVLATITLANNNGNCNGSYCNWSNIGITFSGTAHSVTFSGPADQLGLAYITLNSSTTAIPEPSSFYLLGTGFLAISVRRIRQFFSA